MNELSALNIETQRLVIRRVSERDLQDFFEIVSCEEIAIKDGFKPYCLLEEFVPVFRGFLIDEYRFAIEHKKEKKVIGLINFRKTNDFAANDFAVKAFEIGYDVNKNYQRKGYAYEFLSAFISYCLNNLHIEIITANCYNDNDASIGLLKKLGFCYRGEEKTSHGLYGVVDSKNFYIDKNMCGGIHNEGDNG